MANPRQYVAFNGIGAEQVTVKYGASIVYDESLPGNCAALGRAVRISGNAQVDLTTDASVIVGKLVNIDKDGFCAIQYDGFCTLPGGTAAALTAGSKVVGALGGVSTTDPGYIRNAAAGGETEQSDARAWDATDATAVAVNLG